MNQKTIKMIGGEKTLEQEVHYHQVLTTIEL